MSSQHRSLPKNIKPSPIPGENYLGFKDLSSLDAVKIKKPQTFQEDGYKGEQVLIIHLTITGRCYAHCKDCVNTAVTMGSDDPRNSVITCEVSEPERDTAIIKELAARHPDEIITVCFYGGEPFLEMDIMEEVWRILKESDGSERFRFLVYTNGELLNAAFNLYPEFMKDMWLYSISIDGDEEQHDRIRLGTRLSIIEENLRALSSSYNGHVLQWSTLREEQSLLNCFEEFMRLYNRGWVNHFFWHWAENRDPIEDFTDYVKRYGQEFEEIMDIYLDRISGGEILPIAHINELILYLITEKERGHSACAVELAKNYDIVSGRVYPCADLPSCLSIGELEKEGKLELREYSLDSLVEYKDWLGCYRCGVGSYCGGRCPVQIIAGSLERTYQYCQLMRLHVGIVQKRMSGILEAMKRNKISLQEIYNKSAFLAKYTDVVP